MDHKTTFQVSPRKVCLQTSKQLCLGVFNCCVLPEVKELEISSSFPGIFSNGREKQLLAYADLWNLLNGLHSFPRLLNNFHCSCIHSFYKHAVGAYYVPGTGLSARESWSQHKFLALKGSQTNWGYSDIR